MRNDKERVFIRVGAQLTFSRNKISLLAEEVVTPFKKGNLVLSVSKDKYLKMEKPLRCEIKKRQGKIIVVPVTFE